jgi:deazaflavin-dependent oxidoreductase (nitroreductase family)
MRIDKPPAGTRGARTPPTSNPLARLLARGMQWLHRRQGDRFLGMDVLYLTTVGAKTGQRRTTAVARLADGDAWLIAASNNGAATHPGWYHNIAAHPDQVWIEPEGTTTRVDPVQLEGADRDDGWRRIVARYARFAGYQSRTDRHIPVLRLMPATTPADGGP